MFLFLLLPFVGFYLGKTYQATLYKDTAITTTNAPKNIEKQKNQQKMAQINTIKQFVAKTTEYKKISPSIAFSCYDQQSLPSHERTSIIATDLKQHKKSIQSICLKNVDSEWIVTSIIEKPQKWDPNYEEKLEVAIYRFNNDNTFGTDYLLSESESIGEVFKLIDWFSNDDIIYSLLSFNHLRIKTYVFNLQNNVYYEPTLLEYCTYGIGKGLSIRSFSECKRLITDESSLYVKEEDLP